MLKVCYLLFASILVSTITSSQSLTPSVRDTVISTKLYSPQYLPPLDEKPVIMEFGLGMGLPYGSLGSKISVGSSILTGDFGIGILPFAWDLSTSFGVTLNLLDRYNTVRLKFSGLWSNTVSSIIFIKQSVGQSVLIGDVLYKETFTGFGLYGGVDIRTGKLSHVCLELKVGGIFPAVGIGEIKKRYDRKREELSQQGWVFEKEYLSLRNFPFISLGVNYVLGRSLERVK